MLMKLIAVSGIAAVVLCSTLAEAAPLPMSWRKGRSEVSAAAAYFTSSANYTSRGTYDDLVGDGSLQNIDARFGYRYNLGNDFAVFTGAVVSSTTAKDSTLTRDNSNLSEVLLGASMAIVRKRGFILAGELEGSFTTDKIDPNTVNALTSDGVNYLHPRLFAQKGLGKFYIYGSTGLKIRDEGLSGLLTWAAEFGRVFGKVKLGVGASGYESLLADELDLDTRARVTNRVNAGSYKFYAFEPALIQIDLNGEYALSKDFRLAAIASQSIDGEGSAAGLTVGLQLRYGFDLNFGSSDSSPKKSGEPAFEVDTQEVDPELFEDDAN